MKLRNQIIKSVLFKQNNTFSLTKNSQFYIDKEYKYGCHNYSPIQVVAQRAKGIYIWDVDNKQYYDFISGYSAINQGHCHPKIMSKLVQQSEQMTLTSRAMYNDKLGDAEQFLAETFGYDKTLFMNTGVEAGESSLKLARRWGYYQKKIEKNKAKILFAKGNFWGRSLAACASSEDPGRNKDFGPFDMNFQLIEYNNIKALEDELKKDKNIVAYMLEPIQGEKGVIIPEQGYLQQVRKLCTEYNILMIADEVQTGLGRTGKMLACDHENIKPDLLVLGKALSGGVYPISAVLANDNVMNNIYPGEHGSTYGGNPLACAIVQQAISVLIDEKMIQNSEKLGQQLLNDLQELYQYKFIKDIRGRGLFCAIEFDSDQQQITADQFSNKLIEKGILAKQTQKYTIRLSPPLTITSDELKKATEIIKNTLKEL